MSLCLQLIAVSAAVSVHAYRAQASLNENKWPLPADRYEVNEVNKRSVLATSPRAATLPNFVIFFVDDMGYGDVGFTGHPNINTPNIDALAAEGMILSTWYTGQAICTPSRAAMLTGRYPVRSGCAGGWIGMVFGNGAVGGLPTNETTFAAVLKQAGYASKMIGKWHLGQREQFQPQNHGFDEAFWVPVSVDIGSTAWLPGSTLPPLALMNDSTVLQQPVDLSKVSNLYIEEATKFINAQSASDTPFVLYMAHSHVHVPDFTNTQFCNSSIRGRYGDAVQEVDYVIGSIYSAVQKAGIADNTLTFFTADNGPWLQKNFAGGSAGLFSMGKLTTWEGGMRQPAFAHWPGRIAAGSRSAELVSTMDIFMTMINMTNATQYLPDDGRVYDGKDMSDIIFNENGGKTKHGCYAMYGGAVNASNCPYKPNQTEYIACSGLWSMRCPIANYSGDYKAHWVTRFTNGTISVQIPPLLYNIDWDPSELHPISTKNKNYGTIMSVLEAKRNEALASLDMFVPNQILRGESAQYEICSDPNSQSKYPQYPNCTSTPAGYTGFTCDPVCYDEDNCAGGAPVAPDYLDIYSDHDRSQDDDDVHVQIQYNHF